MFFVLLILKNFFINSIKHDFFFFENKIFFSRIQFPNTIFFILKTHKTVFQNSFQKQTKHTLSFLKILGQVSNLINPYSPP